MTNQTMMNQNKAVIVLAATVLAALSWSGPARSQAVKTTPPVEMAPIEQYRIATREDEIALARSAAPPSISADAEVLVLGNHGYETALKGKNGFVCFVERSWAAGLDDPEFWNPRIRSPNCFNPPAVRTELPQYLQRTEWVLAGAFSFMLSKDGYVNDATAGPWLPHVMFFIPHGQADNWGANKQGSPIIGQDGSAMESTVLFVPVRSWSDGSPAPPSPKKHVM